MSTSSSNNRLISAAVLVQTKASAVAQSAHAQLAAVMPVVELDYLDIALASQVDSTGRYKLVQDIAAVINAAKLTTDKRFVDAFGTFTQLAWDFEKARQDAVGMQDSVFVVKAFLRNFSDAALTSDNSAWQLERFYQEAVQANDAVEYLTSKQLTDGVGMSDSTGIGDGLAFVLTRTVANVAFVADTAYRDSAMNKQELVGLTDLGSVRCQNYADASYFAEDYVGAGLFF